MKNDNLEVSIESIQTLRLAELLVYAELILGCLSLDQSIMNSEWGSISESSPF